MFANAISEKDKRLLAEGEKKALRKTAKQMKADGMPVDLIIKYTGLSQQDINAL